MQNASQVGTSHVIHEREVFTRDLTEQMLKIDSISSINRRSSSPPSSADRNFTDRDHLFFCEQQTIANGQVNTDAKYVQPFKIL